MRPTRVRATHNAPGPQRPRRPPSFVIWPKPQIRRHQSPGLRSGADDGPRAGTSSVINPSIPRTHQKHTTSSWTPRPFHFFRERIDLKRFYIYKGLRILINRKGDTTNKTRLCAPRKLTLFELLTRKFNQCK